MALHWMLLLPATVALFVAASARAEIYRCVLPDGSVRFTDAATSCEDAVPHAPARRVERADPPASAASAARSGALGSLLLTAAEAGSGWEIVAEVPVDPHSDPDLVEWGVDALEVRRYTRDQSGMIEVCSVELWSFASQEQASAAEAYFLYPDWRIAREGSLLLMLHGSSGVRLSPPRRGVFPDCAALGERVRGRARR